MSSNHINGMLWTAAVQDDVAAIERAARAGADLEAPNMDGFAPLSLAAAHGAPSACSALLRLGADPNARSLHGSTAAIWAASVGESKALRELIHAGARLELKNDAGETALISACKWNKKETLMALLGSGGNLGLDELDHEKMSAAMWAAHEGAWGILESLARFGANLELQNDWGLTARDFAAHSAEGRAAIEKGLESRRRDQAQSQARELDECANDAPNTHRSRSRI